MILSDNASTSPLWVNPSFIDIVVAGNTVIFAFQMRQREKIMKDS